ncbi:MAG: hypothetical protein MJ001_09470 [Paludibacteraceae bacterium]|nr:hypothetical protein [Paludibacteraceae bacterium]
MITECIGQGYVYGLHGLSLWGAQRGRADVMIGQFQSQYFNKKCMAGMWIAGRSMGVRQVEAG